MSALEIPAAAEPWVLLTLIALGLYLLADQRQWTRALAPAKLAASTGFVVAAVYAGALDVTWARWVFAGLCLSWVGDACLLSRAKPMFLAGLAAFLLGHVAYCVAFVIHGVALGVALGLAPVLAAIAWCVDHWLRPHVDDSMRAPVRAYIVVISTMLTLAVAAWVAGASALVLIGALAFYLSDLAVARDRFVRPDVFNHLWGLPAYYLGQLCLALAVAT